MSENGRRRLNSWKEIAAHLGRQVRTVVRWEKERGLPVHRLPGGQGRSVFAFTDELDLWAVSGLDEADPAPPARRGPMSARAAALMAVVLSAGATVAALVTLRSAPGVEQLVVRGDQVTAVSGGREIWNRSLGAPLGATAPRATQLIDLDGNQRADGLISAVFDHPAGRGDGLLLALDHSGLELWRRTLSDRLTFGATDFSAPWQPDDVLAFRSGGEPLVAWAVHHHTWWPSMLAVFDRAGARVGTFVNSGWIRTVQPTADGRHLVAGGLNNARDAAAFAVLDARRPDGTSPEAADSPYRCRDCPAGSPLHYIVVPWSDVAGTISAGQRSLIVSIYAGAPIELRAVQRDAAEFIVELSADYEVVRCSAGDEFWRVHQRLERDGQLTHARDKCPFKDGPQAHHWTPSGGWRSVCPSGP
jgi:ribosome modulation factor